MIYGDDMFPEYQAVIGMCHPSLIRSYYCGPPPNTVAAPAAAELDIESFLTPPVRKRKSFCRQSRGDFRCVVFGCTRTPATRDGLQFAPEYRADTDVVATARGEDVGLSVVVRQR